MLKRIWNLSVVMLLISSSFFGLAPTVNAQLTFEAEKLMLPDEKQMVETKEPSSSLAFPEEQKDSDNETLLPFANEGESELEWLLTWEDNFEGETLDETKWNYAIGNGHAEGIPGWGNEEKQFHQPDNVWVEDGKLIIEGRQEQVSDEYGTYDYTSGLIDTRGKFSQKYGKFEARMKLPAGQGYWPAFWMMPEHDVYGGWAASGEIDIMEAAGSRLNRIGGAIHYGGPWPNNTYTAKDYVFPEGIDITDFNVYSIEWEPGEIRWYVNGELYQTLNNWHTADPNHATKYSYPAPFDQAFHIIFDLSIGGWYDGDPDDSTEFPGQMVIDYVRAYELASYPEPTEPEFEVEELPGDAKHAIDGNYVYDPNYGEGFTTITNDTELANNWTTDYWNFVYLDEFHGQGTIAVEQIDGSQFARVDMTNAGNQVHSIQLIQNVTLGTGRWYKLSFDAKSTSDRNVTVKLGGGPERGFIGYASGDFSLTHDVSKYEMTFQMQHESDPLARLEFNMGTNPSPVWLGNVVLEEIDPIDPYNENDPKPPLRDGNHIYNGTFDQGRMDRMTYWNFMSEAGRATAFVSEKTRELTVDIVDGGDSSNTIQLVQTGINLLANDEYELTFTARADATRTIQVLFINEDGSDVYAEHEIELSTGNQQHVFKFTMPDLIDEAGQLVFQFGGSNENVYLDDIKMERLTNFNQGLKIEEIFPLRNGDFTNGLSYWNQHIQGDYDGHGSRASIEEVNGGAKITVEDVGYNPWDIQLFQPDLVLKSHQTYFLEFTARATTDRQIELVVDNGSPAYHRYFEQIINLTDVMETFTFEFTMPNDDLAGLQFLLGNVAGENIAEIHDVIIDDVKLEVKGEREKHFPLINGSFLDGLTGWEHFVQGDHAGDSKAAFAVENGEAKITVEHVGIDPWDIQFMQSFKLYPKTYIVEFEARSTKDRKLEVVLEDASYHRYFETIVELTDTMETYAFEFDMPEDDDITLKFLLGNVANEQISASHDVFIDNVTVEVKGARELLAGNEQDDPDDENEPEDPGDPGQPGEPEDPDDPGQPGKPGDPDDTGDPGDPSDPGQPRDPSKLGKPADPIEQGSRGGSDGTDESEQPEIDDMPGDKTNDGKELPKTATYMFQSMFIGLAIIFFGYGLYFMRNRKDLG